MQIMKGVDNIVTHFGLTMVRGLYLGQPRTKSGYE
jgi:hypothetical protein